MIGKPTLTYADKLKDPRWQRKRLEVMQRDQFTCRSCESDTDTLHVHHVMYTAADPWDEPTDNLLTLCDECHKVWHHLYNNDFPAELISAVVRLYDNWEYNEIQKSLSNGREQK